MLLSPRFYRGKGVAMGNFFKSIFSAFLAVVWWVFERLWGDEVFERMRPMIPESLQSPSMDQIITWGPVITFFLIGGYFFYKHWKEVSTLKRADAKKDGEVTGPTSI